MNTQWKTTKTWKETKPPKPPKDKHYREKGIDPWIFWVLVVLLLLAISLAFQSCTMPGLITASKRAEMIDNHPEWPYRMVEAIKQSRVEVGMTPKMVKASWGNPSQINEYKSKAGVTYQLVYPGHPNNMYVYFENGKVTGVQK